MATLVRGVLDVLRRPGDSPERGGGIGMIAETVDQLIGAPLKAYLDPARRAVRFVGRC